MFNPLAVKADPVKPYSTEFPKENVPYIWHIERWGEKDLLDQTKTERLDLGQFRWDWWVKILFWMRSASLLTEFYKSFLFDCRLDVIVCTKVYDS